MVDFISLYLHIVNIIRYHYFTIKYVESTSIKLKKFDKKIALYQGIERKYFNSTVKLPRYGHPHQQTIQTLKENHVQIRRTDQLGMIQYRWHFSSHIKEYLGH